MKLDKTTIGQNVNVATEYNKLYYALNSQLTGSNGTKKLPGGTAGFIPFNINLTIDGMSGIKIYNKLEVDTSFLPNGYPTSLDFIVTGVDHKLQKGDWETTLKLTMMPKFDSVEVVDIRQAFEIPDEEKYFNTPVSSTSTPIPSGDVKISNFGAGFVNFPEDLAPHHSGERRVVGKKSDGVTDRIVTYRGADSWHVHFADMLKGTSDGNTAAEKIKQLNSDKELVVMDFTVFKGGKKYGIPLFAPFRCKLVDAGKDGKNNPYVFLAGVDGSGKYNGKSSLLLHLVPNNEKPSTLTEKQYYDDNEVWKKDPKFNDKMDKLKGNIGKIYEKGDIIAYQASAGRSSGTHVHVQCMALEDFDKYMRDIPTFF